VGLEEMPLSALLHVKTKEASPLQTGKQVLPRQPICLDLELLASQTVRNISIIETTQPVVLCYSSLS
jgi:hypothetical protein